MNEGQIAKAGNWHCPRCRMKLDGYASADGNTAPPNPGDVTICAYCRIALRFTRTGFEALTREQFDALPEDTRKGLLLAGHTLNEIVEPIFDPLTGRARN